MCDVWSLESKVSVAGGMLSAGWKSGIRGMFSDAFYIL